MTGKADASEPSPSSTRLRLVYIAGIALNVIALAAAARAGEWLVAATFVVVLVYLGFRYRMTVSS